ncbi:MAG: multiubiquitin domain-containing protein [Kiritimatiellae bacterium]|jgi:hypothetical protein|nr:multiubiquitin domain-containing protein [Kiritimatiellia bacterium]
MPKEAVEIEEYAKAGEKIPDNCELFRIRIDGEKYLVQQAALTGAELLHLADKDPSEYRMFFKKRGGDTVLIPLKTNFSFLDPGIERFITKKIALVEITINNDPYKIHEGEHPVARLKKKANIPPDHTLCQIKEGVPPIELNDGDRIDIKGGEVFASHQPGGAAS